MYLEHVLDIAFLDIMMGGDDGLSSPGAEQAGPRWIPRDAEGMNDIETMALAQESVASDVITKPYS